MLLKYQSLFRFFRFYIITMKMWMMFDFLYHSMQSNRNVLIRVTAYNCFAINCHILYVKCSHNSLLFGILESLSHTSICEHNY